MWYIWVGLAWAIWTLRFNNKQRHAVREHWFPVLLFSTFLWPMFMYFAYEKGMAPRLVQDGILWIKWIKNRADRIYG